MKYSIFGTAVFGAMLASITSAHAQQLLLDFSGGSVRGTIRDRTYGWNFRVVDAPITVNGLGLFDIGADGLAQDHPVGLWDSSGTLLASTTVTGTSPLVPSVSPDGDWRMESVVQLLLAPGEYFVGALFLQDSPDWFYVNMPSGSISTLPGVTYGSYHSGDGSTLTFPGDGLAITGAFGPTIQVVVPEPGTYGAALALLAIGGGVVWRRRSSPRSAARSGHGL